MSPKTIKISGKTIAFVGMILAGVSIFITGLHGYLTTQEWGDIVMAVGGLCASVSAYLAHHYTDIGGVQ
jgi:hypothetical protein